MIPVSPNGYLAADAYQLRTPICVIPCGGLLGDSVSDWTAAMLEPYTKYVVNGRPIDDLFGGFIFNGIRTRENHYLYPLFVGFGEPSNITDWQAWIDRLFLPALNLDALHTVAGSKRRDVWLSIPYPHPFQRSFGLVGGRNLDFQHDEDRLAAIEWWLDQLLDAWNRHSRLHDRLRLRGFLWQREAIDANDEPLITQVNAGIKRRGYLSMWLPNYGSYGVLEWVKLGFDVAALNSNYYGNTSYDYNWVNYASMFARSYHTGMQITWGRGLIYSDTHLLDYLNLGLADQCDYMSQSLLVYQFPNQRLDVLLNADFANYTRLYTFAKGSYRRTAYAGMPAY